MADVLIAGADGKARRDFTGRLPFAWPADARLPITKPLFPIGYGLDYSKPTRLGRVNEKPGIDLNASDGTLLYMLRGKVSAPWHLGVDGSIASRAIDIGAQEDARQFSWSDKAGMSITGSAINLNGKLPQQAALSIDWRIDRKNDQPVRISFGGAPIDLTGYVRSLTDGSANALRIPLRCFVEKGAKLDAVAAPFQIEAARGFVASIRTIRVEAGAADLPCPN